MPGKPFQDHTKNQTLLKRVAAGVAQTLPSDPGEEETGVLHALTREPADSFPAAYKREMIRDHTININTCRREISLGRSDQSQGVCGSRHSLFCKCI